MDRISFDAYCMNDSGMTWHSTECRPSFYHSLALRIAARSEGLTKKTRTAIEQFCKCNYTASQKKTWVCCKFTIAWSASKRIFFKSADIWGSYGKSLVSCLFVSRCRSWTCSSLGVHPNRHLDRSVQPCLQGSQLCPTDTKTDNGTSATFVRYSRHCDAV